MITPTTGEQVARVVGAFQDAAADGRAALAAIRDSGASRTTINAHLDSLRRTVTALGEDTAAGHWMLADARQAADELLAAAGTARRARTRLRTPDVLRPLRDALDGVERIARRVDLVARDDAAVASGAMPAWRAAGEAPTIEQTTAELGRIVAKGNDDISEAELWRAALIQDLPASMRPATAARSTLDSPLAKLVVRADLADRFRDHAPNRLWANRELNALRMSVQASAYAATATRETATRDLVRVLTRHDVDAEGLRQVALVANLPERLRPDMPAALVAPMQRAYVQGFLPRNQLVTGLEFQDLRAHLLASAPDEVAAEVRALVDAGQPFSRDLMPALARMDEERLARFGLTREALLARLVHSVGEGKQGFGWGRAQLLAARDLAAEVRVDPAQQTLLDDLRSRLDVAITEVERRYDAGSRMYRTNALANEAWPDFGDIGRMTGTADLLAAMREARDAVPTTVGTEAARTGEALTW